MADALQKDAHICVPLSVPILGLLQPLLKTERGRFLLSVIVEQG